MYIYNVYVAIEHHHTSMWFGPLTVIYTYITKQDAAAVTMYVQMHTISYIIIVWTFLVTKLIMC